MAAANGVPRRMAVTSIPLPRRTVPASQVLTGEEATKMAGPDAATKPSPPSVIEGEGHVETGRRRIRQVATVA